MHADIWLQLDRREFQKKTSHQKLFLYVCEVKEGIRHET